MKQVVMNRVKYLIDNEYDGNLTDFSKAIGFPLSTLTNYSNGRRGVSIDLILAILNALPKVSAEWLLRGKGSMLLADNVNNFDMRGMITGDNNMAVGDNSQVNNADNDTIKMLVEQNQKLMDFIMEGKK